MKRFTQTLQTGLLALVLLMGASAQADRVKENKNVKNMKKTK